MKMIIYSSPRLGLHGFPMPAVFGLFRPCTEYHITAIYVKDKYLLINYEYLAVVTWMPGPMVVVRVTLLRYCPLMVLGFALRMASITAS